MEVFSIIIAAILLVNVEGIVKKKLVQDLITLQNSCDTAGYQDGYVYNTIVQACISMHIQL